MGCSEDLPYSLGRSFYAPIRAIMFLRQTRRRKATARRRHCSLEHRRESASRRWPGGAATGSVSGRDPFVAGRRLASSDRGIRHGVRRAANASLVPRGAATRRWRNARLGGASLPVSAQAVPAAAMGGVLAGGSAVARAAAGPVLGRPPAAEPKGTRWDQVLPGSGGLSADRTGRVSGSCIATGSATVPWPISWAPILAWPRRINCTPAMTDIARSTRTRCSRTWSGLLVRDPFNARFDVLLYDLDQHLF